MKGQPGPVSHRSPSRLPEPPPGPAPFLRRCLPWLKLYDQRGVSLLLLLKLTLQQLHQSLQPAYSLLDRCASATLALNAGLCFLRFVMSHSFPAAPAALSLGAGLSLSYLSEFYGSGADS